MANSIHDYSLADIARILGGKVYGTGNKRYVQASAPGHSATDDSFTLEFGKKLDFVVKSHCGDDERKIKDYVRQKLSLPAFEKTNGKHRAAKKAPLYDVKPLKPVPKSSDGLTPDEQLEAAVGGAPSGGPLTPENVPGLKFVEAYLYTDASGKVVYKNCRYLKNNGAGKKTFRPWRIVDGKWTMSLGNIAKVPYHLDEIAEKYPDAPIIICEGEKDADRVRALGYVATNGADGWWEEIAKYFSDREVIILVDFNNAGTERAKRVIAALHGVARSIKVILLRGLNGDDNNKDVSDWLDKPGNDEAKFADICRHTPLWTPGAIVEGFAEAERMVGKKDSETDTETPAELGEWDAGDDFTMPPPRRWLLGTSFCRGFASSLLGNGGVGKTALAYAEMLSLVVKRDLVGQHVFQRCRVLIASFEDGAEELRRRVLAARLHHGIKSEDVKGWLFLVALGHKDGKLMTLDDHGRPVVSHLVDKLIRTIVKRSIDVVLLDPFIKTHSLNENDNSSIDEVAQILTDMCGRFNIALGIPHHMSKGSSDPGNAQKGRGASALNDALRLVRTANVMTTDEAKELGVAESDRRRLFRVDDAKLNIAPISDAKWFKLVGVNLGNGTELYPTGDNVQTVEVWHPPALLTDICVPTINAILNEIDAGLPDGNRYSNTKNVAEERAAWTVVRRNTGKAEGPAKKIIKTWTDSGLLISKQYENPNTRKDVAGLWVDNSKRPV